MIQFEDHKTIYQQIADQIVENIIMGVWKNGERIPSIRETAIQMEVNPNTVTRTYSLLQDQGIIFNKRGIGYFAADNALQLILAERKKSFIERELPEMFRKMRSLGISMDEIVSLYDTATTEITQ